MKLLLTFFIFILFTLPCHSRSLQEIKQSGYIVIGTLGSSLKPMNYTENGNDIGIDIELMSLIAKELNVTLRKKYHATLDERISFLEDDTVDLVVSSFSVTPERLKKIDFSLPYLITGVGLLMRIEQKDKLKEFNDLTDQKVTLVKGSTSIPLFKNGYPNLSFKIAETENSAMQKLASGKVDGYGTDKIFLSTIVKENPDKYYTLDGSLSADSYGIGVKKNNRDLLKFINRLLTNIEENGQLKEIINKYAISEEKSPPQRKINSKKIKIEEYIIKKGDTLSQIAKDKLGDATKWRKIYELNKDIITYPNNVSPGLKIKINSINIKKKEISNNTSSSDMEDKLKELKVLYDKGYISEKTFDKKTNEILDQFGY